MSARSGSDRRRRQLLLGFRATAAEVAAVQAAAERAGCSVASFIRARVLPDADGPRVELGEDQAELF